jgi:hypothetical protein
MVVSAFGETVITGNRKMPATPVNNPVREADRLWNNALEKGRSSWVHCAPAPVQGATGHPAPHFRPERCLGQPGRRFKTSARVAWHLRKRLGGNDRGFDVSAAEPQTSRATCVGEHREPLSWRISRQTVASPLHHASRLTPHVSFLWWISNSVPSGSRMVT